MRSNFLNALAGLALACAMVACGGQSETAPTPMPTPTPTPTPTPAPTPLAAGIYLFAKSPDSFVLDFDGKNTGGKCDLSGILNLAIDSSARVFAITTWRLPIVATAPPPAVSLCANIAATGSMPLSGEFGQLLFSSLAVGSSGKLFASATRSNGLGNVVAEVAVANPTGVTTNIEKPLERMFVVAADGSFYSSDGFIVRKTTATGVSTILAGVPRLTNTPTFSVDGTGSAARFSGVSGIAVNANGDIYVADSGSTIRKVSSAGVVTTIAGSAIIKGALDGPGPAARFGNLNSIVVDSAGNIFAADTANHAIRKITPQGVVSTVVGQLGVPGYALGALPGLLNAPQALAIDSSDVLYLIVITTLNNLPAIEILKVKP